MRNALVWLVTAAFSLSTNAIAALVAHYELNGNANDSAGNDHGIVQAPS